MRSGAARVFAAGIALTAWAGLLLQCVMTYRLVGSVGRTLGIVLGYFTITTSLLSALIFSVIAAGSPGSVAGWLVAGTVLSEVLVGVVYISLLHGLLDLSGGSAVANAVLHFVLPSLVPLFWMVCTPKGGLRWWHPFMWAVYPLGYLGVAIERGGATGRYPYPFLDIGALGWERVAVSTVGIAAGFLLAAFGLVWLDAWLGRRAFMRI